MDREFAFKQVYSKYPSKIGKKAAYRHFNSSVKNEQDLASIHRALDNYLLSERVQKGYIQNASTWFNNWEDWIGTSNPALNYKCKRCGYQCDAKVSPDYCIEQQICFQCYRAALKG